MPATPATPAAVANSNRQRALGLQAETECNTQSETSLHMHGAYTLADFDFDLPPELIAQYPCTVRSASRLLDGRTNTPADRIFSDLPQLLKAGDLLVFNNTKVLPARLYGRKTSGGKVELLIERVLEGGHVCAHMRGSKKPQPGMRIILSGDAFATVLGRWPDAQGALFLLKFSQDPHVYMQAHGHIPLPPYITHTDTDLDAERYQTVFAQTPGAVAAPTAALHFDHALLGTLDARGIGKTFITLHVGAGTFTPVKSDNITEHHMHIERYTIPAQALDRIKRTRAHKGRIIAVGTTSVRTLETWAQTGQTKGETDIFITPGYRFQVVDALITNFHLPKSTLMMLVSALAGHAKIKALYAHAIAKRYRFFSYGDAMLVEG